MTNDDFWERFDQIPMADVIPAAQNDEPNAPDDGFWERFDQIPMADVIPAASPIPEPIVAELAGIRASIASLRDQLELALAPPSKETVSKRSISAPTSRSLEALASRFLNNDVYGWSNSFPLGPGPFALPRTNLDDVFGIQVDSHLGITPSTFGLGGSFGLPTSSSHVHLVVVLDCEESIAGGGDPSIVMLPASAGAKPIIDIVQETKDVHGRQSAPERSG